MNIAQKLFDNGKITYMRTDSTYISADFQKTIQRKIENEYSDKYYKSMDRALELFNSSETEEEFLKASNYFYRISQAVGNDWLPGYYYALCNFKISLEEKDSHAPYLF